MNIGIYIEMNILSSLLCVLLYYQQRQHKAFDFLGTTDFNSILWSSVCIMLVDTILWVLMGDFLPHTDTEIMLVQSVYYVLQAIIPLRFFVYFLNTSSITINKIWQALIYVPVLYTVVVLVMNFRSGFAFSVLNDQMERGPGFFWVILAPMIFVFNCLVLCIYFYVCSRRESEEKRKVALHMLICILIGAIGATFCVFISYISPWHVFIFSLLYLYIQLHGYREHDLDALAFTDSLTGLRTHAAYTRTKDKINEDLQAGQAMEFAVVMADINYLKQINDTYGHETGNALIVRAAQLICDTFQHSPVYRIGGDEFVAILRNSDYANRKTLYAQFEEQMKTTVFLSADGELPVSVSLGTADYHPEYHTTFDAVFHAADEAMYENKTLSKINI